MLDFVKNCYEVTEENKARLRQLMEHEDIRYYNGDELELDILLKVGHVLGNNDYKQNPKQTGYWESKDYVPTVYLKHLITEIN